MTVPALEGWCRCRGEPSPPGDTVSDYMEENNIDLIRLSDMLKIPTVEAKHLLDGTRAIDDRLAASLSSVVGYKADFWMRRQRSYERNMKEYPTICKGCDGKKGVRWDETSDAT